MSEFNYDYQIFIKNIADKPLEDCYEDELHNIYIITLQDLVENDNFAFESEEELYEIITFYQKAKNKNKKVEEAFKWVKKEFKRSLQSKRGK